MTTHPRPGRRWSPTTVTATLAAVALGASFATLGSAPAEALPGSSATLEVHADQAFRPVTHVATGSLYGLASATVPSDDLVQALKPNTFVQMAPGGHQLPNGEPAPAGDALVVASEAAKAGAKVVVRMSDWYPDFPYRWVGWNDWLGAVDTQVKAVQASGAKNIAAYALWNEPDWTWDTAKAGSFEDAWTRTYREVRSLDATTPIQGPSYSDNISGMKAFLTNAVATGTVPDIIAWHELESSSHIQADIATVVGIEKSLGITPRPIAIEEYATPSEIGIPGPLVGYIAKFERYGVQDAELAFWNHYGTLGDTLTDTGGSPNGSYWLYTWYAQMSGDMVTTTPPSASGLDGAASVTADKKELDVIAGGGQGATAVRIDGLNALKLGNAVGVKVEYTPSYGRTTATTKPITISDTQYHVGADGSITVPIAMNAAYGYHIVVTHSGPTTKLNGDYTISNGNSGLVLGTAASGGGVEQVASSGQADQIWKLEDSGSGLYKVVNAANGDVLGVQGASKTAGAKAVIEADTGTDDQLWQVIPDGSGRVKLANAGSGLVLAVAAMSATAGSSVVQWTDGAPTCAVDGPRAIGRIGSALDFCHTASYVALPSGAVSGLTGDYTVSAWVNPSSNTTWSRVFDFGNGPGTNMFLTVNSGNGLRFAITTGGPNAEQQINAPSVLPVGKWSLVTVTLSGTTGTLSVNGQVVGTNTGMTAHPAALGDTPNNWIGKSQYNDPALDAKVDDLNIYDRALSPAEVTALATGQAGDGDVLHYAFDEADGTTIIDSSGHARNGVLVVGAPGATSTVATDAATADHFWTLTPAER
ncbi:LamG-like jellyroll fold domain-containing protein [Microbacterium panaciterrae]|uniref:Ricin B lectin domain-containing protein n=1 Tax=Microbacterium panaciterrae TaxID=985759 RepID=A0ABP8P636_9MICO